MRCQGGGARWATEVRAQHHEVLWGALRATEHGSLSNLSNSSAMRCKPGRVDSGRAPVFLRDDLAKRRDLCETTATRENRTSVDPAPTRRDCPITLPHYAADGTVPGWNDAHPQ